MSSESNYFRALFEGLVREFGGVDAAASVLCARYGNGHKGTISKMNNGNMAVTIEAAMAMEDACGRYPITEFLADRIDRKPAKIQDIMQLVASASRKHGESISAVVAAFSEQPGGFTVEKVTKAIMQAREAAAEAKALADVLEGMEF